MIHIQILMFKVNFHIENNLTVQTKNTAGLSNLINEYEWELQEPP